jgi:anti-sigma factor RsiW
MNHPTSDLTDLVDGTLAPSTRAAVQAHVDDCPTCRAEVAIASAGRHALAALPIVAVPEGLLDDIVAEVSAAAADLPSIRGDSSHRSWTRWTSLAGVAAAIVLLAVVVLPKVKGGSDGGLTAAVQDDRSEQAVVVELVPSGFDRSGIEALALSYRAASATASPEMGVNTSVPRAASAADVANSPAAVAKARACIVTAFGEPDGTIVRLLEGPYEGTPAVVAVLLSGPGAGQPADAVDVEVAARADCSILSGTTVRL